MGNEVLRKGYKEFIELMFSLLGVGSLVTLIIMAIIENNANHIMIVLPLFFLNGCTIFIISCICVKLYEVFIK